MVQHLRAWFIFYGIVNCGQCDVAMCFGLINMHPGFFFILRNDTSKESNHFACNLTRTIIRPSTWGSMSLRIKQNYDGKSTRYLLSLNHQYARSRSAHEWNYFRWQCIEAWEGRHCHWVSFVTVCMYGRCQIATFIVLTLRLIYQRQRTLQLCAVARAIACV